MFPRSATRKSELIAVREKITKQSGEIFSIEEMSITASSLFWTAALKWFRKSLQRGVYRRSEPAFRPPEPVRCQDPRTQHIIEIQPLEFGTMLYKTMRN